MIKQNEYEYEKNTAPEAIPEVVPKASPDKTDKLLMTPGLMTARLSTAYSRK